MAVPPIINCRPVVKKDLRTLVWLHDAIPDAKRVHDGIVTSIQDYIKWHTKTTVLALILMELKTDDFELLRKHKVSLFITKAIYEQRPRSDWLSLGLSIGVLEELADQFPVLQTPWSGTLVDAVACLTMLLHYRIISMPAGSVLSDARADQFTKNGITLQAGYSLLPQIWLLTQYFVHPVTKRAKEIRQCLKNNIACPYIDRIVLLNESDLKYEWSGTKGSEKVIQDVIRTRLTYRDLLKYTYEKVPPNTIVIYANADIYANDTLKHLYSVSLEDKLFALLRWDEQESATDLKLFGPRPDSQDAWICLSDSVKSRDWKWDTFSYKLGTAGCDNRFTGDMFAMRFAVSNPCQTIQTVHVHKTAIRNYNPTDIVPARMYLYVQPCAIVELDQVEATDPLHPLSPRLTTVAFKGPEKKLETFCIMLARENRFKWTPGKPNTAPLSPLKVFKWSDAFVTNSGVVYDYNKVYLKNDEYVQKVGRDLSISYINPCEQADIMLSIPCPTVKQMTSIDLYCLHYLSYAIQLYRQLDENQKPSLFVMPQSVLVLQAFVLRKGITGAIPAIAWTPTGVVYAKQVVGLMPDSLELSVNEIRALRSSWPEWTDIRGPKCVVLVDEILTPEFIDTTIKPLLPTDWSVEQVLRTTYGLEGFRSMAGASLVICYNLPKQEEHWAKLWAVPKGCRVIEFQNELKVEGGCQQLCGAAELESWLYPLYKGTVIETRGQIATTLAEWFKTEHPLPLLSQDTLGPTQMTLSI
jgi:hypothetical protein